MPWNRADLQPLVIEIDDAEGAVATFAVNTPAGEIKVLAEVASDGRTLRLINAHIEGPGRNAIGRANLKVIADLILEELDYDELDIQAAARTTGANPSPDHRPRFRYARRRPPDV